MTDVLIYWRDYRKNASGPVAGWHSNSQLLAKLHPGDRLWMVTSGKNLGQDAEQAGFLVAVWQVEQVVENPGDDPSYPHDEFRYRIVSNHGESIALKEPVPVDHVLRPARGNKGVSIGRYLQGPRRLDDQTVRLLRAAAGPQMALKWLKGKRE
jgi:hypothetical protein